MVKNFILTSIRNIRKNGIYSLINILGFAFGLACCTLIVLYVSDELSFDKYHSKGDRVYRVGSSGALGGNTFHSARVGSPLASAVVDDYPEVEWATRIRYNGSFLVQYEEEFFKESSVLFADSTLFQTFDISLIKGNETNAIAKPNTLVLSQELAAKYFGDEDPIGKVLILDNDMECKVTGVMKDIPTNTHVRADMFVSSESLEVSRDNVDWTSTNFNTYVVLREGASAAELEAKFPGMTEKYIGPLVKNYLGISYEEFVKMGNSFSFNLDPIKEIHLYSNLSGELGTSGDIQYVYIFSAIALFILLIACINFMNLSTARSASRAKEVGIRKASGSKKSQLVFQFILESVFITMISFILAVGITYLALPYFNDLAAKTIQIPFDDPIFYSSIIVGILFVGTLAGFYPAFYLSSFKPTQVLKGRIRTGAKSGIVRSSLVVFQFATSIILITGTLIIYNQLNYIQNKNLGYTKDQVLVINDAYTLEDDVNVFKEKVLQLASVKNATVSSNLPVRSTRNGSGHYLKGTDPNETMTVVTYFEVDHDYVNTMGIEILDGRDFSKEMISDSNATIVNEAFIKEFDLENPMGQVVSRFTEDPNVTLDYTIVGVMKDFHFESLRAGIEPLMLKLIPSNGWVSIKIQTEDVSGTISQVEEIWNETSNGLPFSYNFMDDRFNNMYTTEQRMGKIALSFSGLAIFIAALGLFALSSFTAEQRAKEIGVRKVMGASISSIILLLSKEYGKLITISFLIAAPLSWYFMSRWLQDFEYKIDINPISFAAAGIIAFCIAWGSMGYQSWRAASSNPARSLRNE